MITRNKSSGTTLAPCSGLEGDRALGGTRRPRGRVRSPHAEGHTRTPQPGLKTERAAVQREGRGAKVTRGRGDRDGPEASRRTVAGSEIWRELRGRDGDSAGLV